MNWQPGGWQPDSWQPDGWQPEDAGGASPPTLVSAVVAKDGDSLILTFDKAVTIGAGGNGGFALTASGGAAALTYASGAGTNRLVYSSNRTLSSSETVTLDYTQPGDGVEDASGNDLANFSSEAVTFAQGGMVLMITPLLIAAR